MSRCAAWPAPPTCRLPADAPSRSGQGGIVMAWQHLPLRACNARPQGGYRPAPPALAALPRGSRQRTRPAAPSTAEAGHRRVLVVSDAELVRLGLVAPLLEELERHGVAWALFDGVTPDPDIGQIEAGLATAETRAGRGAAGIGAARPSMPPSLDRGRARSRRPVGAPGGAVSRPPRHVPLYAIPTTAGAEVGRPPWPRWSPTPARRRKPAAVDPRPAAPRARRPRPRS